MPGVRGPVAFALAVVVLTAGCTAAGETADNPWGEKPVKVYIDKQLPPDAPEPIVRSALRYWENNGQYIEYDVNFAIVNDRGAANLVIIFRDDVSGLERCGLEGPFSSKMGCAPVYTEAGSADQTEIYVWRGLMNKDYAEKVVIHEIGHTLGLDHDDEPQEIMDPELATS